jgi:hypothetical protein
VLRVPPAARISAAMAAIRSARRAPRNTRWPEAASRRAVASPIPLLAPVIRTTLPVDGVGRTVIVIKALSRKPAGAARFGRGFPA